MSNIFGKEKIFISIFIFLLAVIIIELLYLFNIEIKPQKLTKGTFLPLQPQRNVTSQKIRFKNGIHVISDVPGFSIQIKDKTGLQKYLDSIHLLDANGVMLIGKMEERTVKGVEIHFNGDPNMVKFDEIVNPKVGRFAGSSAKIIGDILRVAEDF